MLKQVQHDVTLNLFQGLIRVCVRDSSGPPERAFSVWAGHPPIPDSYRGGDIAYSPTILDTEVSY